MSFVTTARQKKLDRLKNFKHGNQQKLSIKIKQIREVQVMHKTLLTLSLRSAAHALSSL